MTEQWSAEAQRRIAEIAAKNGFSEEAGLAMAEAIARGVGSMAQFNHRDLGGQGQWAKGGMLMVADMFNDGLKARVRALAEALAEAAQRGAIQPKGETGAATGATAGDGGPRDATAPHGRTGWWPESLGRPASSGAQNGMRYAVFPAARRVAIERGGKVSVHDSGDHRIGGVSQQQGASQSLRFTSQHGDVSLDAMPEVSDSASPARPVESGDDTADRHRDTASLGAAADRADGHGSEAPAAPRPTAPAAKAALDARDPLELIRKLAEMRDAGILSEAEFAAKKTELLARL
jgi:hypothetical protein